MDLKAEARRRWNDGDFIEQGVPLPCASYRGLKWVPYEDYMKAQLISCTAGELGKLLVNFPADAVEDNQLHVHPISDRMITVIRGSGEFIAVRRRELARFQLRPGTKVWMPRGVLHTFLAGKDGLLVESLHNPFVAFEDPRCLVYPSSGDWRF